MSAGYDLLIRGARIVDGTGSPWYRADVAIKGDTIVRIAPSIPETAARTIDVSNLVVAPGFIDIHTHARRGIFEVPTADNYVRQGVTTAVGPVSASRRSWSAVSSPSSGATTSAVPPSARGTGPGRAAWLS